MFRDLWFLPAVLIMSGVLAACSVGKYLDEGQMLLGKSEIEIDGRHKGLSSQDMQMYVKQNGNSGRWAGRLLGLGGEARDIYDPKQTLQSARLLTGAMRSKGYMRATVDVDTAIRRRGKVVDVAYRLHPGERYSIGSVCYDVRDTAIARLIGVADTLGWGIRPGMDFSTSLLDGERSRIASLLQQKGYYRFHKDYITFVADTLAGQTSIALTLVLRQYAHEGDSAGPHPVYKVRSIAYSSGEARDPVIHLRQKVLENNTYIKTGEPFNSAMLQRTYNKFGRLGAVKYTNIGFREAADSLLLDCDIQLSTNKPHTISFQPEGTNTAGDLGAAASLTYTHRNLFRGSEELSIELRGAYEAIDNMDGYANNDFVELSVETSLTFPKFIAPFFSKKYARLINASSELAFMYDTQNRPEYHRRVLSLAWRYKWARTGHRDKYQIDLLDVDYVFMPWISDTFKQEYLEDDESRNAILRYNYEDLLIMKWGFGYAYNNGRIAIKANVETAGNLLSLVDNICHLDKNADGQSTLFRIAFAQYVKVDADFTRNVTLGYGRQIAFHAGLGVAYPYGNSTILPFEKRYFSGGANSVRGWSVRELGPGKFAGNDGRIDFINQTGDIKLDLNIEFRAQLFWKLGGALFVDAGNIWTIRQYDDQPGGQFAFDTFIEQLAAAYGFGLRLNMDYFVLRFDFGMKAVNPAYQTSGGPHYPIASPKLSRDLTFHFAVGMPF